MFNGSVLNNIESQAKLPAQGDLGNVLGKAVGYVFTFAGIALLVYFIIGGFQLFTSGGDQKKVAEGKATMTNALIGFVIVFVAFWIVQFFGNLLGLQPLVGPGGVFTR